MRADVFTKEYPPEVYGGAGVHVTELVKAMRQETEFVVRAFGAPRDEPGVFSYPVPSELAGANATLQTMAVDLAIASDVAGADVVHSHTWYANHAGHVASMLHGIPHVVTAHSLEPLRPWKSEQLGGGYRVSSWIERTAYEAADAVIAVSDGMKRDILRSYPALDEARVHTVYNGIDLASWAPVHDEELVRSLGVDPSRPSVVIVGRITRQKGLPYLLRAAALLPADVQMVLCAGAPDTPQIMEEVTALVRGLQEERSGVVWIDRLLPRRELSAVLTAGTVIVSPSVYEPLGIVNLEVHGLRRARRRHGHGRDPRGRRRRRHRPPRPHRPGHGRHGHAHRSRALRPGPGRRVDGGRRGSRRRAPHGGGRPRPRRARVRLGPHRAPDRGDLRVDPALIDRAPAPTRSARRSPRPGGSRGPGR